jgi:hypothetical protein
MRDTLWISQRCSYQDRGLPGVRHQCDRVTAFGYYCRQHASLHLGLKVAESGIAAADYGLFTVRDRAKHELVDEYRGQLMPRREFDANPSAYGVEVEVDESEDDSDDEKGLGRPTQKLVLDSIYSTDCYARFANDALGPAGRYTTRFRNNCNLVDDYDYWSRWAPRGRRHHNGDPLKIWLMTIAPVRGGDELFTAYSRSYWNFMRRRRGSSVDPSARS